MIECNFAFLLSRAHRIENAIQKRRGKAADVCVSFRCFGPNTFHTRSQFLRHKIVRCKHIHTDALLQCYFMNSSWAPFTDLADLVLVIRSVAMTPNRCQWKIEEVWSLWLRTKIERCFFVGRMLTAVTKKRAETCSSSTVSKIRQIVSLSADLLCRLLICFDFVCVRFFRHHLSLFSHLLMRSRIGKHFTMTHSV